MRICTPRSRSLRINATPVFPGTKYGEITTTSCCAERIRAAMLLAIVTSCAGELSLAIFAGRSASTVAATQVSLSSCASSSRASQLPSSAEPLSASAGGGGGGGGGDSTGAASDEIG